MNASLELLVWQRAGDRCEYCMVPQAADVLTHHIDHVIAEQHGGKTEPTNLALACDSCNRFEGQTSRGLTRFQRKSCPCSIRAGTSGADIFDTTVRC